MEYAERLTAPLRWWVQGTMFVASLWLAVVVALPTALAWGITTAAMVLVAGGLLAYGSVRITVADGVLRAGRAHIPLELLGRATPLDREAMRRQAGVDADARAHLLLRPYLSRGLRVDVADSRDPAPYWLLSTRHPDRLAAALTRVETPLRPADPTDPQED